MSKKTFCVFVLLSASLNLNAMHRNDRRHMSKTQHMRFEREIRKQAEIDVLAQQHDNLCEQELELRYQHTWTEVCLDLPLAVCFCCAAYAVPVMVRAEMVEYPAFAATHVVIKISECLSAAYLLPHVCCGLVQRGRQERIAKIHAERNKIKLLLQEKIA